jgi:hypothetical protein
MLLSAICPAEILGAGYLDVVINEIAWMGTENSANDEWIELYSNLSSPIDISEWKIASNDKTPNILLENKILPKGFFILERTDDTTLPNIKANLIYKGSLNNDGEYLRLIDANGKIIDEIDCSKKWFFGDNQTKRTMERKNALINGNDLSNWQTSQDSGGTPNNKNSIGQKIENSEDSVIISLPIKQDSLAISSKNNQETKKQRPFPSFLIALFIAVSSGTFVLFLKKEIDKKC